VVHVAEFVAENPLEQALVAAAADADARPTFYRLLLESPLHVVDVSREGPSVSDGHLETGARLELLVFNLGGVTHVAAFTSASRIGAAVAGSQRYLTMLGRRFLEVVRGSHIALNPGSTVGKQIVPPEIDAILDGSLLKVYQTRTIQKATRVMVGVPKEIPVKLAEGLTGHFGRDPSVKAAWLAQYVSPDEPDREILLIVADVSGDWHDFSTRLTRALKHFAQRTNAIDVVPADSTLGRAAINLGLKLYVSPS
jgi:hypothetical protein